MITRVHELKRDKRIDTKEYKETQQKLTASGDVVTIALASKDGLELCAIDMTPEEALRYASEVITAAVSRLPYYRTR